MAAHSLPLAAGFKVTLTCPDCGQTGLVDWKNLKNAIGCSKCGCQFLLGRNGQVTSQADLPHVRYTCPRCKKSGLVPAQLAVRGTQCTGCKLPLVRGPDQRLMSVPEAEVKRREFAAGAATAVAVSQPSIADYFAGRYKRSDGRIRKSAFIASVAALVGFVFATAIFARGWFDRSPEKLAPQFVRACLAGDSDDAASFFEYDAVHQASFDRWRPRYFSSILDRHRPAGDSVDVEVQVLEADETAQTLLVTLKSDFLGSRTQVQKWHQRDGRWLFDARGTLAREEELQIGQKVKRGERVPRPRNRTVPIR